MSWSMAQFENHWIAMHDLEQRNFMYVADEYFCLLAEAQQPAWMEKWQKYWRVHRDHYINGLSDLRLDDFVDSPLKHQQFAMFLSGFERWLQNTTIKETTLDALGIQDLEVLTTNLLNCVAKLQALLAKDSSQFNVQQLQM